MMSSYSSLILYPVLTLACPALALAFLGLLMGRKAPFARRLAGYGVPAVFLAALIPMIFWHRFLLPGSYWTFAARLVMALLFVVPACLCAFFPKRPCYLLACLCGTAGFLPVLAAYITSPRRPLSAMGAFLIMLAISLSFMGLALPGKEPGTAPPDAPVPGGRPASIPSAKSALRPGRLRMLSGPAAGQSLSLWDKKELRIGWDPSVCHLVLDLPAASAQLCSILWLASTGTYLVTVLEGGQLFSSSGQLLPSGGICEFPAGTLLFLKGSGPLLRLG